MSVAWLKQVLERIEGVFGIAEDAEITLEANPDDLSLEYLEGLFNIGINRLSIGIQTFDDAALHLMNRTHTSEQALQCVVDARRAGFENLSIDLMYHLPGSTAVGWDKTLEQAIALKPEHISAYALTVEPRTALAHQVQTGQVIPASEDIFEGQLLSLRERLIEAGYEHYELSNFALAGKCAIHNSGYWVGKPYLGLGPSAHGYSGQTRYWNHAHIQRYLADVEARKLPIADSEVLTERDRINEYLMVRLRTSAGISPLEIRSTFAPVLANAVLDEAQALLNTGQLFSTEDRWSIPAEYLALTDSIIQRLIQLPI
jgi:oxygen-independent coproporphyrinogen III oxidase